MEVWWKVGGPGGDGGGKVLDDDVQVGMGAGEGYGDFAHAAAYVNYCCGGGPGVAADHVLDVLSRVVAEEGHAAFESAKASFVAWEGHECVRSEICVVEDAEGCAMGIRFLVMGLYEFHGDGESFFCSKFEALDEVWFFHESG